MKSNIEILEQYLDGTLEPLEKLHFENRLLQEPELVKEVNEWRQMRSGIESAGRKELHDRLRALEKSLPPMEHVRTIPLWRRSWLMAAASVSIIALAGYFFWLSNSQRNNLFESYFEPYPNIIIPAVRGDIPPDTSLMAKAFAAYDAGDFDESIDLFESAGAKDEGPMLYLANAYLATGREENAVPLLKKLLEEHETFDEPAEWYLALAYISVKDYQKAKEVLSDIVSRKGMYSERARNLSIHIDSLQ
jgi:tetratricopeptide (TPR) repeat protein